jgi:hypothetical protein
MHQKVRTTLVYEAEKEAKAIAKKAEKVSRKAKVIENKQLKEVEA